MKRSSLVLIASFVFILIASQAAAAGEVIFPENFLWGAATSSYQVEGGIYANDWAEFEKRPGVITNGDKCGAACDHYNRYAEDIKLARELNLKIFRMSVEWSRIEPAEGRFDEKEIAHYRAVLDEVRKNGMTPFVTIFHFCLPKWLADKGGFTNPQSHAYFERYAAYLAKNLGDQVDFWTTQNETMVYLTSGYLLGIWAPGHKNPVLMWHALGNLIRSHARAYNVIKQNDLSDADGDGTAAAVGIVMNYGIFDPYDPKSKVNSIMADKVNYFGNHLLLDSLMGKKTRIKELEPETGERILFLPEYKNKLDFIGVNYYTRFFVRPSITKPIAGMEMFTKSRAAAHSGQPFETNEMGWLIYPEGIYRAVKAIGRYGVPIYITENGIPDKTAKKRAKFIADHLVWLKKAIDEGVPVKGYIHWALTDNFEWAEGFWPRFGLYDVDYSTQKRSLNEGGAFYAEVARNNGLTAPMMRSVYGSEVSPEEKIKRDRLFDRNSQQAGY